MFGNQLKQLRAARAEVARLERLVKKQLQSELGSLPHRFGFKGMDEFIRALKIAVQNRERPRGRKKLAPRRRPRAIITNAVRVAVINMAKAGRSEAETGRSIGISGASVHNIKKRAGLVKARK